MNKKLLRFIEVVRGSFHDASIVYTKGGCYGLYQIIKDVFPNAEAYFSDADKEHIYIKLDNEFYDIYGIKELDEKENKASKKLTPREHEYWKTVASGQRLEFILAKYTRNCRRLKKDI